MRQAAEPGNEPRLPAALSCRLGFVLVRASAGMTRLGASTLARSTSTVATTESSQR